MTSYDIYIFFLCMVTLALAVSVFSYIVRAIIRLYMKSLRAGLEDEVLKAEYQEGLRENKKGKALGCLVSVAVEVLFLALFLFSIVVNVQKDMFFPHIPTMKMVQSGSMSRKHDKNVYLAANHLNDQIQTFDLIFVYQAPAEEDLQLYDVVLYEVDGTYIIHRIVGIEEPNEQHPQERYFLCQGDAVETPDRFPVYYSQIRAVYTGQRIPFVGSFVSFLQSPAGWFCLAFVLFAMFGAPALERKIERAQIARLKQIRYLDENGLPMEDGQEAVEV